MIQVWGVLIVLKSSIELNVIPLKETIKSNQKFFSLYFIKGKHNAIWNLNEQYLHKMKKRNHVVIFCVFPFCSFLILWLRVPFIFHVHVRPCCCISCERIVRSQELQSKWCCTVFFHSHGHHLFLKRSTNRQ